LPGSPLLPCLAIAAGFKIREDIRRTNGGMQRRHQSIGRGFIVMRVPTAFVFSETEF